MKAQVCCIWTS